MGALRPRYMLSLLDTDEFHRGNRCFRRADARLLQEDSFYKFDETSETARRLSREFPPNELQLHFCRRSSVSPLTWSFFKSKFEQNTFGADCIRYRLHKKFEHRMEFFRLSSCRFLFVEDGRDFKIFVEGYFLYEILRRLAVCVRRETPTLQDLCMKRLDRLVKSCEPHGRKWFSGFPPKIREIFLSWEGGDGAPTHAGDREVLRSRFSALRDDALVDLFREKDAAFSREFVAWFRNDGGPDFGPYKRSHVPVRMTFKHELSDDEYLCLKCMKRYEWANGGRKGYFERKYQACADFFDRLRRPQFWCRKCTRVPIFQIWTREEYENEYGKEVKKSFELFVV